MSGTQWIFAPGRSRSAMALALAGIAVVVIAWFLAAPNALADGPGCADGNVCVWTESDFNGNKSQRDCQSGATGFDNPKHSAKNRCGARSVVLAWYDGFDYTEVDCIGAGGNRPDPGRFNYMHIGTLGSSCG
jgi:hypothetical protein